MATAKHSASPRRSNLFSALTGGDRLRAEKARLEAFLAAFPGDYCGFGPDGMIAYSEGFCQALSLDRVQTLQDIQSALSPADAMALEGLFTRLQEEGENFCIPVRSASDRTRTFRLCGTRGRDTEATTTFDIVWLEDTTAQTAETRRHEDQRIGFEQDQIRLQSALDYIPMPVWMRDNKADLIWCNRKYAALLDTTPASVVTDQREFAQTAKKAGLQNKTQHIAPGRPLAMAALESGNLQSTQAHMVLGGARRLLQVQEIPLPGLGLTIGVAHDRTREEELETENRRSSTANRELLEHLGSAIAIFNADQKIEFFNTAFSQLWHLEDGWLNTAPKLGDIMEKLRETRRLPEQADFRHFKQGWLNMFTGLIGTHEDMLYLPDGRALRMLVIPHPLGGLMMTFEDVTSSLELESSYNTLIAVQKETLDNLSEGVVVFGSDGRLKLWNPPFAELWLLNPEDLDGNPHISRVVDKMKHHFTPAEWITWRETLIGLGIGRVERDGRIERLDQSLIDYATVPLPDGGVLMTQQDVTSAVQVEIALRERNTALETAERLKLDFLANVSYQLRTPLNAIIGFAEILDKQYFGTLNPKQMEYTSGLQEAGARLVSLIDDILDLSSIEAGYMELDKARIDAHVMLLSLEDMVRDWAGTKRIKLRLTSSPAIGFVFGDATRLRQVMVNLIRNAITFTPEGGQIAIDASRSGNYACISVIDTGPGIAPEDQARMFEPFERLSPRAGGKLDNRGAGLGLTLVKNIIELHGGEVMLESEIGKGTKITVSLPVTE